MFAFLEVPPICFILEIIICILLMLPELFVNNNTYFKSHYKAYDTFEFLFHPLRGCGASYE
jgi:hypothetical protein